MKKEGRMYFMAGVLWTFLWVFPPIVLSKILESVTGWPAVLMGGGILIWTLAYPWSVTMERIALRLIKRTTIDWR